MNKVSVVIHNGYISFSKFNKSINGIDLNNTNVIDTKNIKFTEDYILDNLDLVSAFLNLIVVKTDTKKVKINNLNIAETVLKLIKNLSVIEEIVISEDKEISYSISSLLLENKNLKKINCYSMPEIMFYRFPDGIVDTRCEYLFLSNFMKDNNINTYSSLCNKDKIIINGCLSDLEIEDLKYFFSKNKKLRKIYINNYSKDILIEILNLLKDNNLKLINIIICEGKSTTECILSDIKFFNKFNKMYNVRIKIKYSRDYIRNNRIQEVNIHLFRVILIVVIILLIFIIFVYKQKGLNDDKNTQENINKIYDVIEEVELDEIEIQEEIVENDSSANNSDESLSNNTEISNHYVNPYHKNYDKVYNKLLEINRDTVGWITVNNTNINYPVVQTTNNDYYLKHAYDKSNNQAGWIFVDYRNDLDRMNQNTIIYGHNIIQPDLMFGSLKYTLEPEWYNNKDNLKITFSIKEKTFMWEVFAVYIIDKTTDYLYTDFDTEDEFLEFIDMLKSRSIHDFGVEFNKDDKIITLSTCHGTNNKRLVLHAKMLK
jgi:sortase B